ncbi:hypothetical protein OS493_011043 [Desmophyllum pertusum]|uniref:Cadherin domain-containing protein n=1 Tax=Desmophyllum pertusum TaxID=174260 RepID=A0A9X0CYL4_9CNID|nr:hypothetical protein OS493_011043 [Desmophyllum pertusum]
MGNTAGLPFTIDGNALNSTSRLNYEAHSSWNIAVQSLDSGDPQLSVCEKFPDHRYCALSNDGCLKNGGNFCKLNYEKRRSYTVSVRATDNGNPPQSSDASISISLNDVNDLPRDFKLSSRTVKENATIGTKIGRFTATDEDMFQTLAFSLVDSDGGRFAIDSAGYLSKAKDTDYETNKAHKIIVTGGRQRNSTIKRQQSFPDNAPKVNENTATNKIVGTLQALDHDEVQTWTFSLDDDANGKFTAGSQVTCHNITNIPGVKTMCTTLLQVSGELDFEASPSEDILVRVTDTSGLFRRAAVPGHDTRC